MARFACGWSNGVLLLFDIAAHRQLVVRGGVPCRMGLGRDVRLFGAGQRNCFPGAFVEIGISRLAMAYRRDGWAGGERTVFCGDCGGLGWVCLDLSGGEVLLGFRKIFNTEGTEDHGVVPQGNNSL